MSFERHEDRASILTSGVTQEMGDIKTNIKQDNELQDVIEIPPELFDRRMSVDLITELLRESILSGQLQEGMELNQARLAKLFDVNRIIIREAVRQLQGEGLVEGRPHRRAVVATMSTAQVAEMIDICMLIEVYLLERSIPQLTPPVLAELHKICDEMDSIKSNATGLWYNKNQEFHMTLYRPSGATFAAEFLVQLWARVERYFRAWAGHEPERLPEQNEEHRRILEAVERKDTYRAVSELRMHDARTKEYILSAHK